MRRRNLIWSVIRLATLLSCVAIVAVLAWGWVASAGGSRSIYLSRDATPNASAMVFLNDGALRVSHWWFNPQPRSARKVTKGFLGFGFHFERAVTPQGKTLMIQRFWVPIWFGIIVFLLPPCLALWRGPMRRHRRHYEGLCPQCGYNLAGNISGVCTECGAICPPPPDPATRMRRRSGARLILTGGLTLCTLVMLAAWTISYATPLTREWTNGIWHTQVATLRHGAVEWWVSETHQVDLMVSTVNLPKPGSSVNNILGLRYVRFTDELQFVND